jgi:uncharacterized surface protein with fasciclin (FAS1) repeats
VRLADCFINRLQGLHFRDIFSPLQSPLEFNMRRIFLNWMAALGTASLLAACGGGGSGDAAAPAPTGTTPTPAPTSIAQAVNEQPDLSALKAAVLFVDEDSDDQLMPLMAAAGDKTLFAPNNAAFDKLAQEMIGPGSKAADLLAPEYKDDLRDILKTNMMVGRMLQAGMSNGASVSINLNSDSGSASASVSSSSSSSSTSTSSTVSGTSTSTSTSTVTGTTTVSGSSSFSITITIANGVITITDGQGRVATIRLADILTGNGVLHITDCVLMPPKPMLGKSIVAVAKKTPQLSSLVAALGFASNNNDLVKLLSKRGTYTVFAPTNDAFNALAVELLGAGKTATDLLVPANKALVRGVLQYHVLGAVVKKADIPLGKPIDPILEGHDIFKIDAVGGKVIITDGRNRKSEIITTDIAAKNGVVHLINKVILPADKNIVQTAIALAPEFSILVKAVVAAGLTETLSGPGPFTVFAPTDAAFASLLAELKTTPEALLANKPLLIKVLTYHVVPGLVLKADVPVGVAVKTVQGDTLTVDAGFNITDQAGRKSAIVTTDVLTKNGVIHVIDKVILPKL